MAHTKKIWVEGEVITASALNNAESQYEHVVNDYLNQEVKTSSSPTFAGMTINGNISVSGNVDGVDVSALKSDHDAKLNQAVKTTSTPTFASVITTGKMNQATDRVVASCPVPSKKTQSGTRSTPGTGYWQVTPASNRTGLMPLRVKLQVTANSGGQAKVYLVYDDGTKSQIGSATAVGTTYIEYGDIIDAAGDNSGKKYVAAVELALTAETGTSVSANITVYGWEF